MEMNYRESHQRVRAENPTRKGIAFLRAWHQQVTIGDEGNEQKVQLTGKSREEVEALTEAIRTVVSTHQIWTVASYLSHRQESVHAFRIQAQKDNSTARTLLAEHGVQLRGFALPAFIEPAR